MDLFYHLAVGCFCKTVIIPGGNRLKRFHDVSVVFAKEEILNWMTHIVLLVTFKDLSIMLG